MNEKKFAESLFNKGYKRELNLFLKTSNEPFDFLNQKNRDQICVAIHQPAYFGWLGYFHKILYSDKFIILDDVTDAKSSFTNRCKIELDGRSIYLTIPIKKKSSTMLINEFKVDNSQNWQKKHQNIIFNYYKKSKYFDEIYNLIVGIFKKFAKCELLTEITYITTQEIINYLKIKNQIYFSSIIDIDKNLKKEKRNYALVNKLKGNIYLSGITAKSYQNSNIQQESIKLIYQDFWNYQEKKNLKKENIFINGLSVIDTLFKLGPEQTSKSLLNYINYSLDNIIDEYIKTEEVDL